MKIEGLEHGHVPKSPIMKLRTVLSFALSRQSLASAMERVRGRATLLSLHLGNDSFPGAGFSGLHLTRMVVDLPELQD